METLSSRFKVMSIHEDALQQVLDLYESNPLFFKYCPPRPTLETITEDIARLPDGKSRKDKFYVGFWDGNCLVAVMDFVRAYPDEETVFIGFFMLHKVYQGNGLGSYLFQEVSAYFANNFKKIRLAYVKGNPQAHHFWEKQGFLPIGREVEQELYTVVIMEKVLCRKQ